VDSRYGVDDRMTAALAWVGLIFIVLLIALAVISNDGGSVTEVCLLEGTACPSPTATP
jgi:preprotein translocase subunit SecG